MIHEYKLVIEGKEVERHIVEEPEKYPGYIKADLESIERYLNF